MQKTYQVRAAQLLVDVKLTELKSRYQGNGEPSSQGQEGASQIVW